MRLVIHNRQGSAAYGMRRYQGSGILSSIGRKLFSSGLKKAINIATKANLPQKIANIVVNGAQSAGEKLGKAAVKKIATTVRRKRVGEPVVASTIKYPKVDIDRIINSGSGIIYQ